MAADIPTLRPATEDDLAALNAAHARQGYATDAAYFPRCLNEQKAGHRVVFLIALGDHCAGYGMLNFRSQYALYRRLNIPEIQDLNVVPNHRRQGLAAAAIQWCEEQALQRGHDQIGISVGLHTGFGAAQRLYIKLGYMPDGYGVTYDRLPVTAGEIRPVDDNLCLMMTKNLGAAA